jgi:hypothetical protein
MHDKPPFLNGWSPNGPIFPDRPLPNGYSMRLREGYWGIVDPDGVKFNIGMGDNAVDAFVAAMCGAR